MGTGMAKSLGTLFALMAGAIIAQAIPHFPAVVISSRVLVGETITQNGVVESNEVVTYSITFRNAGQLGATNATAFLLATNGITPITPVQSLGTLLPGEFAVRDFTFRANARPGTILQANFIIATNGLPLFENAFDVPIAASNVFSAENLTTLTVPIGSRGDGPASLYPSPITVSGATGSITSVRVTLHNYAHDFPEDVNVLLVSPQGTAIMLMSDCGGPFTELNANLTFETGLTNNVENMGDIKSGRYAATDINYPNTMASPAPVATAAFGASLSVFNKQEPNGTWYLWVCDTREQDDGAVRGGWSLTLTTQLPPTLVIADNHDGRVRVNVNNTGKRSFLIDYSTNLVDWVNMGQTPSTFENAVFFDTPTNGVQRFYRARRLTP